jgi:hypothetical protein
MTESDLLLRSSRLEHQLALPVLGIDTRFESNSADVLTLVEVAFGRWRELSASERSPADSARIRVLVNHGSEQTTGRSPISYVSPSENRVIIESRGSIGFVDAARRESIAYVTSELVGDRDHFRVAVLEAMTFALLACFDRHPIHAAAITTGERTVLLAGPSGSGKSTLAYLAHSAGIDVLSDDHVWVQLEPDCRIWGSAPHARLLEDALTHFPEVTRLEGASQRQKIAVQLPPRNDEHRLVAYGPVVCVLARGTSATLEALTSAEIAVELERQLTPGFDRFPVRQAGVVREIAKHGGWRLTLSANPRDALPLFLRMLDGT